MKIKHTIAIIFFAIISASFCTSATADLVVSFSIDNGATFENDFQVTTGNSLTVGIYLLETAPDTVLTDEGLLGFGLTASTAPTNLGSITSATINPVFDFASTNTFTPSTINWEAAALNNSPPTGSQIQLGMFQFDANMDGATLFTLGDIQPGTGTANTNWLSAVNGSELDQQIFGAGATNTFQLTINASSAIPEPSSMAMLLSVSGLVLARRRRSAGIA